MVWRRFALRLGFALLGRASATTALPVFRATLLPYCTTACATTTLRLHPTHARTTFAHSPLHALRRTYAALPAVHGDWATHHRAPLPSAGRAHSPATCSTTWPRSISFGALGDTLPFGRLAQRHIQRAAFCAAMLLPSRSGGGSRRTNAAAKERRKRRRLARISAFIKAAAAACARLPAASRPHHSSAYCLLAWTDFAFAWRTARRQRGGGTRHLTAAAREDAAAVTSAGERDAASRAGPSAFRHANFLPILPSTFSLLLHCNFTTTYPVLLLL